MNLHAPVGRRTALGAAAWTAPVVAVAAAAPAHAASGPRTSTVTATTADYSTGTGTVTFLLDPAPTSAPATGVTYSVPASPAVPVLTDIGPSGTGRLYRFTFTLDIPPTMTTAVTVTISPTGYPVTSTVVTFGAGSRDTTFTGNPNDQVRGVAVQADGKILIGGSFTTYNGTPVTRVARLNTDGSLDPFTNPGAGADSTVFAVASQAGGKILVGGAYDNYDGTAGRNLVRVNADGSRDTTFVGSGAGNVVYGIAVQTDGKILIAGDFSDYNGTFVNRLARLNADGSFDPTFPGPGAGDGADLAVFGVAPTADGKILISGDLNAYSGFTVNKLARLNGDGSFDTTFDGTGSGPDAVISAVTPQADGKILIGGDFTSYDGNPVNRLARLNADGSLDTTFTGPGTGPDAFVSKIAVQADKKILIVGTFSSYDGAPANRVARLNG